VYSAAIPQRYSSISAAQADLSLCVREGNIRSAPTAVATATSHFSSTSARLLTTTEPRPTGTSGNHAETWKGEILAIRADILTMGISIFLL
jgi:hypothetical protein